MTRTNRIGKHQTKVRTINETTSVMYHQTVVVAFNHDRIVLNTGGFKTATTKLRMNQASNQFKLGFTVHQKGWVWYVTFKGEVFVMNDTIVLHRTKQRAKIETQEAA